MLNRAHILPWRNREQLAVAERIGSLARIRHTESTPARRSLLDAARLVAPDRDAPQAIQAQLPIELPPAA